MFEFVLMVALANAIMLACLYILRHVIAIRAPVLLIAVGISVLYCILYPFLVSWVPYPKVLYIYALLIMIGAAVLYAIETRFFSVAEMGDSEVTSMPVGDALMAVDCKKFSSDSEKGMRSWRSLMEGIGALPLIVGLRSGKKLPAQPIHTPDDALVSVKCEDAGRTYQIITDGTSRVEQPVEAELTPTGGVSQDNSIERYIEISALAPSFSPVVATTYAGTEEKVEDQDYLEAHSTAEPLFAEEVQSVTICEAVSLDEVPKHSFEDSLDDKEEIGEEAKDVSEKVEFISEKAVYTESQPQESALPVSLDMLDALKEVVVVEEPDKSGNSTEIMRIFDADKLDATEEDIISSGVDHTEDNLLLQDQQEYQPEEAKMAEVGQEEQPASAKESEISVQEVAMQSADEVEESEGIISEVITPDQGEFKENDNVISGGETRDVRELTGDSQISMMVARAFDDLYSGDSAGAVEGFFRILKMDPPPKLAVMLCIEISSIYLARGHKRQALAVLEMLEVVWGHALDSGDANEVKIKIKRLRGELQ